MGRVPVAGFVGGSNQLISRAAGYSQTVNWYPETGPDESGKPARYLRPASGMQPFAEFDNRDTSAMLTEDGRTFVCCGNIFGEVLQNGTSRELGVIPYDGFPCSLASNGTAGHQVMVVTANRVFIYDTLSDAFEEVDFSDHPIIMCEFMDGYFFAVERDSRLVFYSALENGLDWSFTEGGAFQRQWGSDNISFIKRTGRQLFVVGTKTGEVWADSGNATIPWAPIQGVFIDQGSIAPFAGQRDGDTIIWLNQDERGGGMVVRANGYTPERISTYSVETQVQAGGPRVQLATAEAFVHQGGGHLQYWLYVEGLKTTPVLDLTEKEWSERAMWNDALGDWEPHKARCHTYAFEKHLVGVRDSGVIYQVQASYHTDGLTLS